MNELKEMTKMLVKFRDERNWEQFHTGSNLAKSISIEAAEILEIFQWSDDVDKEHLAEEISDVIAYTLQLAEKYDIDVYESFKKKIKKNAIKYPVK